ncbi:tyrosine--tRNA ligase [candidate division CPR3 bacterium 4484_211]|uniref:Tyrosine--tRNA ligase n=1 Tax=candidate division CPR3 bacterium 4484_211 TaxID=1968527 RepID=A0A1W9NZ59_UNCC3|nr:MAG: tyrosine--tRNA ligase [candidate division CPR3 bacterium 4484_211]
MKQPTRQQLDHLLSYNIDSIYPSKEAAEKMLTGGKQISIYIGVDPSGPQIHLGHAVVLRKLREFQNLGHKVIFLIGDFTGMIGDPTDKTAARVQMTPQEVKKNAQTYRDQVSILIDFKGDNPAEIKFNSTWLSKLAFGDLIELASHFTVQQMLERDMFQKRIKQNRPIYLHEFFYPLMQGYDSVAMNVDAEIGGTDQTFNMLAGRNLMKSLKNKEKLVFTCPLLLGTDGRKMSKSLGNTINVWDSPKDMYGKLMSVKDELIINYLMMCTDYGQEEISNFQEQLDQGENPMEIKKLLAYTVTKFYHGEKEAEKAEAFFKKVVQEGQIPQEIPIIKVKKNKTNIVDLLAVYNLCSSKAEAKRLIKQGGVEVNGEKITSTELTVDATKKPVIKVGKRKFVKIVA